MSKEFNNMVDRAIKAIKDITPMNQREDIYKMTLIYAICKLCETEEIFNDNLRLLDRQAENGSEANYQKKIGGKK